jgi:hypothetical protein
MVTEEEMKAKIQEYKDYLVQIKALIEKFVKETEDFLNKTNE